MNNQTIKLLAVALLVPTLSQARQISGVVLSENDSTAVAGAVCELNSEAAAALKTVGDTNGAFSLNTPGKNAATGFYRTQESHWNSPVRDCYIITVRHTHSEQETTNENQEHQ